MEFVRDQRVFFVTAFLRAVTTSLTGVLLGLYLAKLNVSGAALGFIISAGLIGATLAALGATVLGDRFGRRQFLMGVTAVSALGTLGFALVSHPALLGIAAFCGMVNGMGKDRGAALILEQATLPETTTPERRTQTIAWYTMLQDLGHAAGAALVAVVPVLEGQGLTGATPHRALLIVCAGALVASVVLYARTTSGGVASHRRPQVTPRTRAILVRVSSLFAIDALGGGFLTTAMLSYFFFERFGASPALIGGLFVGARAMNAASHLGAAWLAKRIGLINTMVFTHIPSSVLLVTVAFAPNLLVASILFLLREGLVEMDVPTRQSWVLAVVQPEERTLAAGVTNLVRLGCWAVAPSVAGLLSAEGSLMLPLVVGAAMKVTYDVLLWRAFRSTDVPA